MKSFQLELKKPLHRPKKKNIKLELDIEQFNTIRVEVGKKTLGLKRELEGRMNNSKDKEINRTKTQ